MVKYNLSGTEVDVTLIFDNDGEALLYLPPQEEDNVGCLIIAQQNPVTFVYEDASVRKDYINMPDDMNFAVFTNSVTEALSTVKE